MATPDAMRSGADGGPEAIRGHRLLKRYGRTTAVAGVDLSVEPGECLALFGHNGAGKTTLLKMLAGLARPTEGRVLVFGEEVRSTSADARRRLGFLSHETLLYDELTGVENLAFYARLYGLGFPGSLARRAVARAGLEAHADLPVGSYSRGMQQRLALARATLHDPDILLLDEPFTGLDPGAARALSGSLRDLRAAGKTVVLTTHDIETGYRLADRVAVMRRGRLVREDSAREGGSADYIARIGPLLAEMTP